MAGPLFTFGQSRPSPMRLSDQQRLDWLRLTRSENVGPRTFQSLINRFGGASAALAALPDLAGRGGGAYRPAQAERISAEIAAVRKAMADPEVLGRVRSLSGEVFPDGPDGLVPAFLKAQQVQWARVVRERKITVG